MDLRPLKCSLSSAVDDFYKVVSVMILVELWLYLKADYEE